MIYMKLLNVVAYQNAMIKQAAKKGKVDPNSRDASFSADYDEETNTVTNPHIKVDAPDKHDSVEAFIRGTNKLPKGVKPTPLASLNAGTKYGWGDYRPGELPWQQKVVNDITTDPHTAEAIRTMERNMAGGYGWPKADIRRTTRARTLADLNKGPMNDYRPGELDWRSRTVNTSNGAPAVLRALLAAEKKTLDPRWTNWPVNKPTIFTPGE